MFRVIYSLKHARWISIGNEKIYAGRRDKIDTTMIDRAASCILNGFFSFERGEKGSEISRERGNKMYTKQRVIFQVYGPARMSFVITCHHYIIARNDRTFPIVSN